MYPTTAQQAALLEQCGHARYVWNLALEQWSMWTRDKASSPGFVAQSRQLTDARGAFGWLRAGSHTVQQQALRDSAYLPNRRRAKAGLNRGILANGWGLLVRRLEHKAPGRVEKVNPAYTSQTCSACGHCALEHRESQAVFRCVACGHRANADVNAAVNIAAGRAVSARRETPVRVSPKREPQHATSA
jgi:transposase